ncbi:hypothetical protein [Polycladomyces subterraneus]|uniref:Uncharacterized protein n=1 Tax=Polycladomyces subterraneus TaxID=1016997 RepID=A0ABT8IMM2_9BACL|nr:hypothetical protein [Polycladomyces subterraneus]MDN4594050.1 hypothetical protein [Polycladomyces subterraneus]
MKRWFQRAVGKAVEVVLLCLVFGFLLALSALEAGLLWMILWGWSVVLGHGAVWGHTDFWTMILVVSFFQLIEERRTRFNRDIKRRLLFHGVEVAVVGGLLTVGTWLNGMEVELPLSVICPASVSYVLIMVAVNDFFRRLESNEDRRTPLD